LRNDPLKWAYNAFFKAKKDYFFRKLIKIKMGSGHANYLKLLKNICKNTHILAPYRIELFWGKKSIIQINRQQQLFLIKAILRLKKAI